MRSAHALAATASEKRLRFLDALAQATRTLRDANEVMQINARMLGKHLGVSRRAFSESGDAVLRLMRADLPYVNADLHTAGNDLAAYRATYN